MRVALLLTAWLMAVPALAADRSDSVLIDQHGQEMPASRLSGHFLLVYFGYTSCPDLCPTALTTMSRAVTLLGAQGAGLLPLFVTVDPQHDTVEVMSRYAAHFSPQLIALTGSPSALSAAQRAFNVTAHRASAQAPLDHSLFLYFAAPNGKVLKTFHANQSAQDIAQEIRAEMQAPRRAKQP